MSLCSRIDFCPLGIRKNVLIYVLFTYLAWSCSSLELYDAGNILTVKDTVLCVLSD